LVETDNITKYYNKIFRWLLDNKGRFKVEVEKIVTIKSEEFLRIELKNVFWVRILIGIDKEEWVYVKIEDEIAIEDDGPIDYYKCDQLEGFFQLIKDKFFLLVSIFRNNFVSK
jgi:hypothetical protein